LHKLKSNEFDLTKINSIQVGLYKHTSIQSHKYTLVYRLYVYSGSKNGDFYV